MGPLISLRSAMALLGRFPALAGVDMEVAAGEVVLVAGPNGAGKSTLLRVCAGLTPLSAGHGVVLGADLARRQRPRGVGYLGHASGLYDDLTAAENVAFQLRLRRRAADPRAALDRVGLGGGVSELPVSKLSAGQRRRVALAVLVSSSHSLWLLDEPHAGLDHQARLALDEIVREAATQGAAIVLASHELEQAGSLAGRRIDLEAGRTAAVDAAVLGPAAPSKEPADVA